MKRDSISLIIIYLIIFLGLSPSIAKDSYTNLSEKQKTFTAMIESLDSGIETKWINEYTIVVTYPYAHLELMTESEIKNEAKTMAKLGNEVIEKNTCVKIISNDGKELAFKCVGNTPI